MGESTAGVVMMKVNVLKETYIVSGRKERGNKKKKNYKNKKDYAKLKKRKLN
jgi:hypothetical protein